MRTFWALFDRLWTLESQFQQRLAWRDAAQARVARDRAVAMAQQKERDMLEAHPSGQLGASTLDDEDALKRAGLL